MANLKADRAKERDMSKSHDKMTRQQMQNEAVVIESLLVAVQALYGGTNPSEAINLVDMAVARASQLNRALDSVNVLEVTS